MMLGAVRRLRHRCKGPVRRLSSKVDKAAEEKKPVSMFLAKEDTLTTRIMGSDWADRRGQPVSFTMKLYWSVFGLFILNGVYAQYTGKDEFDLYHDVRSTVKDAVFGNPLKNEHVFVSETEQKENDATAAAASVATTDATSHEQATEATVAATPEEDATPVVELPPVSAAAGPMAAQKAASPLFGMINRTGPSRPRAVLSKEQLEFELNALREQEAQNRRELRSGSLRNMDVVAAEIQEIQRLKAELKRRIKAVP